MTEDAYRNRSGRNMKRVTSGVPIAFHYDGLTIKSGLKPMRPDREAIVQEGIKRAQKNSAAEKEKKESAKKENN